MKPLYHRHRGADGMRVTYLLEDEVTVVDAAGYNELEGTKIYMHIEAIVDDEEKTVADTYGRDPELENVIWTTNLRSEILVVPSWQFFVDNLDSYLIRVALT